MFFDNLNSIGPEKSSQINGVIYDFLDRVLSIIFTIFTTAEITNLKNTNRISIRSAQTERRAYNI